MENVPIDVVRGNSHGKNVIKNVLAYRTMNSSPTNLLYQEYSSKS